MNKQTYFFLGAVALGYLMRATLSADATGKARPLFGAAYAQGVSLKG